MMEGRGHDGQNGQMKLGGGSVMDGEEGNGFVHPG
jgi:hypothetical protein